MPFVVIMSLSFYYGNIQGYLAEDQTSHQFSSCSDHYEGYTVQVKGPNGEPCGTPMSC